MKIAEAIAITILGIIVLCSMVFSVLLASGMTDQTIVMHGITLYKFFLGSGVVHLTRDEVIGIVVFAIGSPVFLLSFIYQATL